MTEILNQQEENKENINPWAPKEWNEPEIPIVYQEPNEFEKNMIAHTLNAEQLLEMERQEEEERLKKESEITEEEKENVEEIPAEHTREYIEMVKLIAITECGHFPLTNPSSLDDYEKDKIKYKMEQIITSNLCYFFVEQKFNEICTKKVFSNKDFYKYWQQKPI
jgi:hypothetical protein